MSALAGSRSASDKGGGGGGASFISISRDCSFPAANAGMTVAPDPIRTRMRPILSTMIGRDRNQRRPAWRIPAPFPREWKLLGGRRPHSIWLTTARILSKQDRQVNSLSDLPHVQIGRAHV